ncbi:MAG: hypothetical protein G3M78_13150 [Candidatus Nitrohelix vancouverensis]|uniref:Transmembrane protein n=1 Tax=Candidatus Nitrohelix vancouverensis TaxID=2705534 RepID=A0A7T0G4E5_9BACT|nr:MAG: hypothetical protein G3M78_13150 [Candidatus Nitrohelix vancouverensis]
MTSRFLKAVILSACLCMVPGIALAHGGEKHEEHAEEASVSGPTDSMYAVEEAAPALDGGLGLSSPLSRSNDLFADDLPSMAPHEEHGDSHTMEHSTHTEIELAKREWNSSSRKGYGLAVGLTLLTIGAFAFLSIKRPGE